VRFIIAHRVSRLVVTIFVISLEEYACAHRYPRFANVHMSYAPAESNMYIYSSSILWLLTNLDVDCTGVYRRRDFAGKGTIAIGKNSDNHSENSNNAEQYDTLE
jgi:hypothetical protein